jgi:hypothetical protein
MLVHVIPNSSVISNIEFEIRDRRGASSIKDSAIDLIGDYFPPFLSQIVCHGTLFRNFECQQTADCTEFALIFSPFMRVLQILCVVV